MNAFEKLRAAGVSYSYEDGRLKYRAPAEKLTPEVVDALNKAKGYLAICQDKARAWGNVPPENMPPRGGLPRLTHEQEEIVFAHVLRQPDSVLKWALDRATVVYETAHPDIELRRAHLAAALDVIAWQRPDASTTAAVVEELESLERANQHFNRGTL